jgi:hypothetical protein
MSATECLHCDGWGCTRCQPKREAGEQGLNELELELVRLRNEVRRLAAPVCCPSCGTEVERSAAR